MAPTASPWRAFLRRYVIALGVAFVLVVGGIVVGDQVIDAKLNEIHRIPHLVVAPEGPAQAGNFLIVGSDTRQFVDTQSQVGAFGDPKTQTGQRSDTLMVVHVDPASQHSLLVSFPRDLRVNIPGHGTSKINAAFNDSPQKVIETMKVNFNVDIQHYVEIDFKAFTGIVDAIGKIPVYFDRPVRDVYSGLDIQKAGCVSLNGQEALEYVRARHLETPDPKRPGKFLDISGRSDLDRIDRQQGFIRKLAALAAHKGANNPIVALDVADSVVPKLQMDGQLSKGDIFRLVNIFRKVNPNDSSAIEMVTVPTKPAGADLALQQPAAEQLLARLRTFGAQGQSATTVVPSRVRVQVLNGSSTSGAAGAALAALQGAGFGSAGTGNAPARAVTEVRYRAGSESEAQLVAAYLVGMPRLVVDPSIAGADVVVVIGADFRGVVGPGKQPSAPASSTTTTAKGKAPPAPTC